LLFFWLITTDAQLAEFMLDNFLSGLFWYTGISAIKKNGKIYG
jgi:hypothetical protein